MLVDPKKMRWASIATGAVMMKLFLIACGYLVGGWIDRELKTEPYGVILGFILGMSTGIWWIVYVTKRIK